MSIEQAAQLLRDAYTSTPIEPLRAFVAPQDAATAYDIQSINTQHWLRHGRTIVGRKAGLTAKSVQRQLGVDQPDFGVLFDDMRIPDAGALNPSKCLQAKAEAEIAFVLRSDLLDPATTMDEAASSVGSVHAAIEIVDSRIANWNISFADTVADNGSSAFFVMSDAGKSLQGLDLWSCGMVLEINGAVQSVGAGAAVLDHPLNALAWLARTLAFRGEPLRAGQIILAGALGPMVALTNGDHVRAVIGGVGEATFRFEQD